MSCFSKPSSAPVMGALLIILYQWAPTTLAAVDEDKAASVLKYLIPAVAYGSTFVAGDKEGRKQFYKSAFTTGVVTGLLKEAVNKTRPDDKDEPFHDGDGDSFPSGHTSISFQGAAFIHERYGWKYAIPVYLAAAYVGHSRIDTDAHDEWDVLAGAALGIVSSFYFTTPYEKKSIQITPLVGHRTYGLRFSANF